MPYTTNTQSTLVFDKRGILTALVSTGLISAIGGSVATFRITESNTFRLNTTAIAIEKLQNETISRDLYEQNQQNINTRLQNIEKTLDKLDTKLDKIVFEK